MGNALGRIILLLGVLVFGICYGITLSSSGIEQVYGPIDPDAATQSAGADDRAASTDSGQPDQETDEEQGMLPAQPITPVTPSSDSLFLKLLDKLGSLLNLLADYLIRLIVKLGETVLS